MSYCPCQSEILYENCCGLYIENQQAPSTPEQLMRSRYTAYTLANTVYIKNTMKKQALIDFNAATGQGDVQQLSWMGLTVIQSYLVEPDQGFVEFCARYLNNNQLITIHELSEFHKENERWFYVDGVQSPTPKQKIARNNLCPCGSSKKFKNCHEK